MSFSCRCNYALCSRTLDVACHKNQCAGSLPTRTHQTNCCVLKYVCHPCCAVLCECVRVREGVSRFVGVMSSALPSPAAVDDEEEEEEADGLMRIQAASYPPFPRGPGSAPSPPHPSAAIKVAQRSCALAAITLREPPPSSPPAPPKKALRKCVRLCICKPASAETRSGPRFVRLNPPPCSLIFAGFSGSSAEGAVV